MRLGLSWQVIPKALMRHFADPDRAKADRAMQAMLQMRKIDVAALDRAAGASAMRGERGRGRVSLNEPPFCAPLRAGLIIYQ